MILLRTGKVLIMDGPPEHGGGSAQVWNPDLGTFEPVAFFFSNLFCSGHVVLSDGRVLVVGGHIDNFVGIPDANLFDPGTQVWAPATPMLFPRWYPTASTLPDGRVIVLSGSKTCSADECNADIPEIYDQTTKSWQQLTNANLILPLYPFVFVLPDGRVLNAGSDEKSIVTRVLDTATQTWTVVDPIAVDGGSAAMYQPGKVIKSGTAGNVDIPSEPAASTTYVLDINLLPIGEKRQI